MVIIVRIARHGKARHVRFRRSCLTLLLSSVVQKLLKKSMLGQRCSDPPLFVKCFKRACSETRCRSKLGLARHSGLFDVALPKFASCSLQFVLPGNLLAPFHTRSASIPSLPACSLPACCLNASNLHALLLCISVLAMPRTETKHFRT